MPSRGTPVDMGAVEELLRLASPPKGGSASEPRLDLSSLIPTIRQTVEELGDAAKASMLGELLASFIHGRRGGDPIGSLKELTGALRDLHDISMSKDEMYRRQIQELEARAREAEQRNLTARVEMERLEMEREKSMAEVLLGLLDRLGGQGGGGQAELVAAILRFVADSVSKEIAALREELRELKNGSGRSGVLETLRGLLDLAEKLANRGGPGDLERTLEVLSKLREAGLITGGDGRWRDPESLRAFIEMERLKLERELKEREIEAKVKETDARVQGLQELARLIPSVAQAVRQAEQGAVGQPVSVTVCGGCGRRIYLEGEPEEATCPYCRTVLRRVSSSPNGGAGPVQAPTGGRPRGYDI